MIKIPPPILDKATGGGVKYYKVSFIAILMPIFRKTGNRQEVIG